MSDVKLTWVPEIILLYVRGAILRLSAHVPLHPECQSYVNNKGAFVCVGVRNSCSIVSGDVSNSSYRLILSRVRMSVRPSILFYMRKTLKISGKPGGQCQCLFQWPATSHCHQRSGPTRLAVTDPSNSDTATYVCACVRAGACARMCVHACMHACVRDVFAIYDNNI